MLRGCLIGGLGTRHIALGFQRTPGPVIGPRQADRGFHRRFQPREMAQGGVGIAQPAQGDEARQKLQINEIAALGQLMRGGCPIGQALLPVAHQPARHQRAAVGPCLGPAQGRWAGRAFNQKCRRIGVILAPHPPRKAFIGQPRIVTQSLRHGID